MRGEFLLLGKPYYRRAARNLSEQPHTPLAVEAITNLQVLLVKSYRHKKPVPLDSGAQVWRSNRPNLIQSGHFTYASGHC
jgi:hypothetical protein